MTPAALRRLYAALLRLYPARFRAEHAEEMAADFADLLRDAQRQGPGRVTAVCARELWDLPQAVMRAHWREGFGKEGPMWSELTLALAAAPDDGQPGTHQAGGLAALPLGVLAVIFLASTVAPVGEGVLVALGLGAVAGLLAGLVGAWRAGWPRWSATWVAFWALLAVMGAGQAANALRLLDEQVVYIAGLFALFGGGLPLAIYATARQDRLWGLLLALPLVVVVWFPALEFVPNAVRAPLEAGMCLGAALTAYASLRWGRVRAALVLVIGLNLLIGLAVAYSRAYLRVFPADAPEAVRAAVPVFADFLYWLLPTAVALMALAIGPVLARALWQLGRLTGVAGVWASRLVLAGLWLSLVGNFGSFLLYMDRHVSASLPNPQPWLTIGAYGGLGLAAVGLAVFLAQPMDSGRWRVGVLAAVVISLPFAALLPLWMGSLLKPGDVPFAFLQVHAHPLAAYLAALLWGLLAGGTALGLTRRS